MAQLMTLREPEMIEVNGRFFIVEFRRSKADGVTFDIKHNASKQMVAQSICSYEALYQARKDARATLGQMQQFN